MSKTWAIQITEKDAAGNAILLDQRVVYADTELQARVQGAGEMKVDPSRVTVTVIGENPDDSDYEALREAADEQPVVAEYMRSPGNVS